MFWKSIRNTQTHGKKWLNFFYRYCKTLTLSRFLPHLISNTMNCAFVYTVKCMCWITVVQQQQCFWRSIGNNKSDGARKENHHVTSEVGRVNRRAFERSTSFFVGKHVGRMFILDSETRTENFFFEYTFASAPNSAAETRMVNAQFTKRVDFRIIANTLG